MAEPTVKKNDKYTKKSANHVMLCSIYKELL